MSLQSHSALLSSVIKELSQYDSYKNLCHQKGDQTPLPSIETLQRIISICRTVLFPGYFGNVSVSSQTIHYHIGVKIEELFSLLSEQIKAALCFCTEKETLSDKKAIADQGEEITAQFIAALPKIRKTLHTDIIAAYNGDPAAKSISEVILCYPSVRAISNYRIAHELLRLGVPLIPRILTEMAHSETGIDIHPGAQIGESFAIDHGTGVVIGATSIIGKSVKIYQGVTLGAKSFPLDKNGNPIRGIDRHPIIEDEVIIYSNATILGRITIGKGATIGGNIWVTEDVPPTTIISQHKANR